MIKKIYGFNGDGETLFKRTYEPGITDSEIQKAVRASPDCSFVHAVDTVVYRRLGPVFICFVVAEENEMYVLALIAHFISAAERLLGEINEATLIYNFKGVHTLLDGFVLDGKVAEMDSAELLRGVQPEHTQ
ncbi:AP-4 complex subunit sigma-1 [Pancytospora philotis]|nr:AP-4 complex subunit sigma-1 [Pancytospora philotis]